MLKGDLAATPLPEVLRRLADGAATGCLHVLDAAGEKAAVYLRGGRVYAVVAPGKHPALGSRLVSSGALGPEALAEALEAQRTELQGWRLGELLVHLGYVDQPVVEDFIDEQVRASLSYLLPWRHATWRFRVNERTREDVAPPVEVEVLLAEIEARQDLWAQMELVLHGPDAVPALSAGDTASDETEIDPDAWSLLCKVDGVRSVTDLARECGFTLHEAGQVVYRLVTAGLLDVEEPEPVADESAVETPAERAPAERAPAEAAPLELAPREVAARLAFALTGLGVPTQREDRARGIAPPQRDDEVSGSISRVSEGLAALLGPATASDDVFGAPVSRARTPQVAPAEPEDPKRAERARRAAVRRDRDAAELASAQAGLEATKAAQEARFEAEHGQDHVAEVVDLSSVRAAAEALAEAEEDRLRAEAEAAVQEAAEQARLAVEEAEAARLAAEEAEAVVRAAAEARLAEEQRLAEEAVAQARLAAEAEAEAAEQARLAEAARLAEEARLEEARLEEARAAEEARLAEQAADEVRIVAEAAAVERARQAEEQRRTAEAERLAEEQRLAHEAADQARLAAEVEAARLEEEARRAAGDDAAERARVAEELRLEQEHFAAEQARRDREREEQDTARREQEAAAAAEFAFFTADLDSMQPEPGTADAETQAAAFAELSASAAHAVPVPAPAPDPVAAPAASDREPDFSSPAASFASDTDTASLLRELSSLGLDDDAPPPVTRTSAPRPVNLAPAKKRKGLFGRG